MKHSPGIEFKDFILEFSQCSATLKCIDIFSKIYGIPSIWNRVYGVYIIQNMFNER